jgi:dolichol-phosphate mannosyltransferase
MQAPMQGSTRTDREDCEISVVVPVYNERGNIEPFLARIEPVLQSIGSYEVIFCLDPSTDGTEEVIRARAARDPRIGLIAFSRRFGQPAATMAGILNCRGRWCAVIDVDLQDPPELIATMHAKAQEGYEVVYAQRRSRAGETLVKRAVSNIGYRVINRISDIKIPRNTGDFRVMSRRVIDEFRFLSESHGFLRGLVALVGFRQAAVQYDRDARHAGRGNYNRFLGSLRIGFNGIVGFSSYPLSLMMWSGFAIAGFSVLLIFAMVIAKLILQEDYPLGIPTITVLVLFMGGVQLMSIGVLGEYIGRIYDEVRRRPHYIVDHAINVDVNDPHGPGVRGFAPSAAPGKDRPDRLSPAHSDTHAASKLSGTAVR